MKQIIITIATIALVGVMALSLCACTPADRVNQNLNQEADKFKCLRRITVYNARTDLIILEVEGYMSLSNNTSNELVVTCKTAEDTYKKKLHLSKRLCNLCCRRYHRTCGRPISL